MTQSLYNLIRENPKMKKLTISDIKEILKVELVVFFTSRFSLIESHMDCVLQCVQNEQMDYNSY
ncbi:uncharacterized protein METZ01_LOCUS163308 [marine metagenome]|uniref:Uncharacterized protein n=1 Tax=marine metagenome TaxID=408172 RepID=A0A382BA04_9ZZZZ